MVRKTKKIMEGFYTTQLIFEPGATLDKILITNAFRE